MAYGTPQRQRVMKMKEWSRVQNLEIHCGINFRTSSLETTRPSSAALIPRAMAAAEHGVAGHATSQPGRIDAGADGGDHAAPLVPETQRIACVALVQVGHLTGPELDVGAAEAGSMYVDDDLSVPRDGVWNFTHVALVRPGDHEGFHLPFVLVVVPCAADVRSVPAQC